ncbi:beta-ketoacyl synthase chain length factor [Marinigracilibium pacificum]|uniref:Beta-ketoacyl synthase-like N-terminal domain-containing protein n=1 Tax=Marinigracilibium pacificum TaxID=2729599 RepID=A0A848IW20_9BACT|nr:beta-ketoacyl synthase chain length factor [Marinigracilibium pacificum]NMM47886.1 hypothetical protein [Marinigracilibium pacificum]
MKAFILASSAISPQNSFGLEKDLNVSINAEATYLKALEPKFRDYLDPKMARRMARIIKMGIVTASDSLSQAKIDKPDAICIGTGLGCLEDTKKFLDQIDDTNEGLLSPTSFIQSTHNTIAGQIALLLQCDSHNFTFANRGFSFENALEDGIMLLEEGVENVLVGGIDEVIADSLDILEITGCGGNIDNEDLPTIGEGSTMFILSSSDQGAIAQVSGVKSIFGNVTEQDLKDAIDNIHSNNGINRDQISSIVLGCGSSITKSDFYKNLIKDWSDKPIYDYKALSGDYFSSSAFGLHMVTEMIKNQRGIKRALINDKEAEEFENVLLISHSGEMYKSIFLISRS